MKFLACSTIGGAADDPCIYFHAPKMLAAFDPEAKDVAWITHFPTSKVARGWMNPKWNSRSNEEWVAALRDEGSPRQMAAFNELGHYLRYYLINDVRHHAASLPALADLDSVELEAVADDVVQIHAVSPLPHPESIYRRSPLPFLCAGGGTAAFYSVSSERNSGTPSRWLRATGVMRATAIVWWKFLTPNRLTDEKQAVLHEMAEIVEAAIREDLSENQAHAFTAYHFRNLSVSTPLLKCWAKVQAQLYSLIFKHDKRFCCA